MPIKNHRTKARPARVLMYSHDSFGLGHLRRCREIAHSLVQSTSRLSVLILSGSPIIGNFDFRTRVDFVRIPGVIKLRNGDYTSLSLHMDIDQDRSYTGKDSTESSLKIKLSQDATELVYMEDKVTSMDYVQFSEDEHDKKVSL